MNEKILFKEGFINLKNKYLDNIEVKNLIFESKSLLNKAITNKNQLNDLKISENDFNDNSFKGLIKSVIFSGTHTRYKIIVKNLELECSLQSVGLQDIKTDDTIYVHLPSDKIWAMNE